MSMHPMSSAVHPLVNTRRRRAHLIAGTCVVAAVYAAIVLFLRIALL